jgi:hypothetical protein
MTDGPFERMQKKDARNEVRILWSEIAVLVLLGLLIAGGLFAA